MLNNKLLQDQTGATAIEYGLIAALIAVTLVGAMSSLGGETSNTYATVAAGMNNSAADAGDAPADPPMRQPSRDRGNRVPGQ